jgi:hypothetical protein
MKDTDTDNKVRTWFYREKNYRMEKRTLKS